MIPKEGTMSEEREFDTPDDWLARLEQGAPPLDVFAHATERQDGGLLDAGDDSGLIDVYRNCLDRGLTYARDSESFLDACKRLSKLLFRYGRSREANNYLLQLRDLSSKGEIPVWVWNYSAKLEYFKDLASCVRYPETVLYYLEKSLEAQPDDQQAIAITADFLSTAVIWLEQPAVWAKPLEKEPSLGAHLSESVQSFLNKCPQVATPIVLKFQSALDEVIDGAESAESEPSDLPTTDVPDAEVVETPYEVDHIELQARVDSLEAANGDLHLLLSEKDTRLTELEALIRDLKRQLQERTVTIPPEARSEAGPSAGTEEISIDHILPRRSKILIVGESQVAENQLWGICKSLGLRKDQVEFVLDYNAFDTVSFASLRYNSGVAGILVGPVPHKVPGCDDPANTLQQSPGYPPTVKVTNKSGELKITKSSFRSAVQKLMLQIASAEPSIN